MSGRIYLCHHLTPDRVVSTSLFSTILSGHRGDAGRGLLDDSAGANIASPNWHSEMRHQYHVWQERLTGLDYVGFEHYRRIFYINPLSAVRLRRYDPALLDVSCWFWSDELCPGLAVEGRRFDAYLDLRHAFDTEMTAMVDTLMADSDIVTPRPQPQRLDEQFKACHCPSEWEIFVRTVRRTPFYARSAGMIDFSLRSSFFCNMYIMRTALFVEYMEFWWQVMKALEGRIERQERSMGYFSERLINLFVNGKRLQDPGLRVRALPVLTHRRAAAR